MRAPLAPVLWIPPARAGRANLEGFDRLGLGNPTTLWLGQDQDPALASIVTRYGAPWAKVVNAPGTLSYDATSWALGTDTNLVVIGGGGAVVEVGLSCPGMVTPATTVQVDFTWSCPVYWPAAFAGIQVPFALSNNQLVATQSRLTGVVFSTATAGGHSAVINGATVTPPTMVGPFGFDTTAVRRGLVVSTSQVRGGSRVWQSKIRVNGLTYDLTSAAVVSVATGVAMTDFTQGFRKIPAAFASSNLGFGGACCWRDIGASDAQLTGMLDTWQRLYPL
jgi:hypothetical protein